MSGNYPPGVTQDDLDAHLDGREGGGGMDEHESLIEASQREELLALRREVNRLRAELGQPPLPRIGQPTGRNDGGN
jgi:hypothetical protein